MQKYKIKVNNTNISEENVCDINNEINNIIISPNAPEEHSIYLEIEIETTCIDISNGRVLFREKCCISKSSTNI